MGILMVTTEVELDALRSMTKRVTNPGARWSDKPGHKQRNFQVRGGDDDGEDFGIYQRQNRKRRYDFSCGISYLPRVGKSLILARYHGPSHIHGDIAYQPHIHRASEQAIAAGKRPEWEARAIERFDLIEGAFKCLIEDVNVTGLNPHDQLNDQLTLFFP